MEGSMPLMHKRLEDCLVRYPELEVCKTSILEAFEALKKVYENNGKLLLCGNGGSASDVDHISGELLKGFCSKRPLDKKWEEKIGSELFNGLQGALPALPLPCFTSLVSAFCNDCDPDHVYAQLTFGLGQRGDGLLCLSTSGNSANVLHAAKVAKAKDMVTIGLAGETGGKLKSLMDVCICVPSTETFKIQEYHLPIYHTLCLLLEDHFFQA